MAQRTIKFFLYLLMLSLLLCVFYSSQKVQSAALTCSGTFIRASDNSAFVCGNRNGYPYVIELRDAYNNLVYEGTMDDSGYYNVASSDKFYQMYWEDLTVTDPLKRMNMATSITTDSTGLFLSGFTIPSILGRVGSQYYKFYQPSREVQSTNATKITSSPTLKVNSTLLSSNSPTNSSSTTQLQNRALPRRVMSLPPYYKENSGKIWEVYSSTPDQFKLRCLDAYDHRTALVGFSFNSRVDKFLSFMNFFDESGVNKLDMLDATGDDMNTLYLANGDVFRPCFYLQVC